MFSVKAIIVGVVLVAVVTIIGLGYRHYTNLVETVNVLTGNNAQLNTAVGLQKDTIDAQAEAIGAWSTSQDALLKRFDELRSVTEKAATETRRLNDIFSRHDLTVLARRKPGLIERRINRGTHAAQRVLRCASGAVGADCPGAAGETTGDAPAPEPATD